MTYTVADHVHETAKVEWKPDPEAMTHDKLELEGLSSYQRMFFERMSRLMNEGWKMPIAISGYAGNSWMRHYHEHFRQEEEWQRRAIIVGDVVSGPSTARSGLPLEAWELRPRGDYHFDIESDSLDAWCDRLGNSPIRGKTAKILLIDEHHLMDDVTLVAPTGRASALINEHLGKQVAAPSPKIDVPAEFKDSAVQHNNRAARRRAGRKERNRGKY